MALLYRFGYGFRLPALHARGFKCACGLEGVESSGSHALNCNGAKDLRVEFNKGAFVHIF